MFVSLFEYSIAPTVSCKGLIERWFRTIVRVKRDGSQRGDLHMPAKPVIVPVLLTLFEFIQWFASQWHRQTCGCASMLHMNTADMEIDCVASDSSKKKTKTPQRE